MDENADQPFETSPTPEERKRSGAPPFLSTVLYLSTIFLVGLVLGNFLWRLTADVLAFGREDHLVEFSVSESDSLKEISLALKENELIDYPWLFRLYAKLTHAESKIRPGTYQLYGRYDYHALIRALSAGKVQRSSADFYQGETQIQWLNWNYSVPQAIWNG